jgi:hypothetical protein
LDQIRAEVDRPERKEPERDVASLVRDAADHGQDFGQVGRGHIHAAELRMEL